METLEYRFVDKSAWGSGPWIDEPDKLQWPDPVTGLACLAVRNPVTGAWCGYVGITEPHPWFGRSYQVLDKVVCHGGLTFSGLCMVDDKEHHICHRPAAGEPERVWWLGFDCGHYGDLQPGLDATIQMIRRQVPKYRKLYILGGTYRDLDYVKRVCAELAKQLTEAAQ